MSKKKKSTTKAATPKAPPVRTIKGPVHNETEPPQVDQPKEVKIYDIELEHRGEKLPITYNSEGQVAQIEKYGNKFFELGMLEAIAKLPYRSGICMDIGANVGNHTVFFSRFCNFDEVWAYEPFPESFALLQENVENNTKRTVRLFNCAIGAKREFRRMTSNKENPSQNKITKAKGKTLVIPITTNLKVALMKIDVEGFELEVIKGAYGVIDRERPELFIEHHGDPKTLLDALPPGYRLGERFNNAPTYHFTSPRKA